MGKLVRFLGSSDLLDLPGPGVGASWGCAGPFAPHAQSKYFCLQPPPTHPSIQPASGSSLHPSVHPSIHHPSIRPRIHPSICPFIHLSIHLSTHPPSQPPLPPSLYLSTRYSLHPIDRQFLIPKEVPGTVLSPVGFSTPTQHTHRTSPRGPGFRTFFLPCVPISGSPHSCSPPLRHRSKCQLRLLPPPYSRPPVGPHVLPTLLPGLSPTHPVSAQVSFPSIWMPPSIPP